VIAVIVPTLDRADRLAALVANIREVTTAEHRIYLVMERDDRASIAAAASLETIDVIGEFGCCSAAINAGYWASDESFVAIANDDCVFHLGWDTALHLFREGVHVVGLNDGGGDCKCFSLVRRSFIEQHSGVYDKPNTLFHTYRSQGPDTEFAFYAMLRGVWTAAPECVIEHRRIDPEMHFKARDSINEDLAEYNRRWPEWDPDRRMPPAQATVSPL
jgi:hypothetical protein